MQGVGECGQVYGNVYTPFGSPGCADPAKQQSVNLRSCSHNTSSYNLIYVWLVLTHHDRHTSPKIFQAEIFNEVLSNQSLIKADYFDIAYPKSNSFKHQISK